MTWLHPQALWALLAVPFLAWWLHRQAIHRRHRLRQVLGSRLEQSVHLQQRNRRRLGRMSFTAAFVLSILAWAQPQWGVASQSMQHQPKRWLLCLDVSRSMLAMDHANGAQSRLQGAREWIRELCLQSGGDQMALIIFAGKARLMVPLTEDLIALTEMLDLAAEDRMVGGGSDLGAALELALQTSQSAEPMQTAVIMLSDGEDWGPQTDEVVAQCREQGLALTCLGFGSPLGSKIPTEGGFWQDSNQQDVITSLQTQNLQQLADSTGGQLLLDPLDLQQTKFVLPPAAAGHTDASANPSESTDDSTHLAAANRFQWPLALACLLWLVELLTSWRRRK